MRCHTVVSGLDSEGLFASEFPISIGRKEAIGFERREKFRFQPLEAKIVLLWFTLSCCGSDSVRVPAPAEIPKDRFVICLNHEWESER